MILKQYQYQTNGNYFSVYVSEINTIEETTTLIDIVDFPLSNLRMNTTTETIVVDGKGRCDRMQISLITNNVNGLNIDRYTTQLELVAVQVLDEFGDPVLDEFGEPVMTSENQIIYYSNEFLDETGTSIGFEGYLNTISQNTGMSFVQDIAPISRS